MTAVRPAAVIVLAAGEGTRMKSATPKVLHAIGGRSLVGHAIVAARGVDPAHLVVVVRHERERVAAHITDVAPEAIVADQDEVKGTGRAVECGLAELPQDLSGTVVVTYGDVPLLQSVTLSALLEQHDATGSAVTVVTAHLADPTGYGRIVRGQDGSVDAIVEQKDATPEQRAITEINSGLYAFDAEVLRTALAEVGTDNAQGEKYLTDVLAIAKRQGLTVSAHVVDDLWQTEGVNDRVQLATLGKELNRRIVEHWMREGVTVVDPATTWIDADVAVGRDTVIRPGTQLLGATTIGAGAEIGPDTTLQDTQVGDGASVIRSQTLLAEIGPEATVGPFSYLRPGTTLGRKGKIGGFVETKNAQIGDGAKVPHLTYCGDATIGEGSNIGAGTIFANYDGEKKYRSTLGKHVFVGSNSVLVAPAEIGDGAFVAAGSAINQPVGAGDLAVARGRQRNIPGYIQSRRPGSKAAEAAAAAEGAQGDESNQEGTTR
ncbi:bifunctional UDP-N-acetylglucosamine diphosphorylase/glucosamine-1-phosphate N-acetyltransferase GlmU [Arsenicicoccus sp. oral taxon 190]|uniref:bifunctional UDP-N-acetylglucosamine diphosphorylase/glucosamine-1-phosphate N-acetyltransferase GlmU n=1 Tax=Arsenicicoccus sp. oral taxon 190 TaxID=1658671 RepID=UPI00067A2821|nr:bifunctional UDP-N-acetylglucosamine diphosphorylase/glucosamine-1-phosphate N-acetyltransferase GlmU [Arsenicicoccus sp. oral taxon 190]AKT50198.1 bifunctional N-acetylglucosamine-1-phosphate uridyltransferase/glucosamine-1-phosphate acetyltransferase [Arsenicicoccus sp. oral taxon 190]